MPLLEKITKVAHTLDFLSMISLRILASMTFSASANFLTAFLAGVLIPSVMTDTIMKM